MKTMIDEKLSIDKTNWTPIKFGDVVFEPKESSKDPHADGIEHVVGLEHIEPENIHLKNSATLEESTTFTKRFAIGDVLFGRRRAYLKKAAQASFSGICSGDITVFRVKENLMPELLPFIVNNEKFFDYAVKHSAGGLSPRVKFKDLANFEFLLPPKDQQAQLAKLLWAMDEVIEREKEVFENIKVNIKAVQKKLFNKENYSRFKLENYATVIGGYAFSSKSFTDSGVPVIKIKNIVNGKIVINENSNHVSIDESIKANKYALRSGDVLIAMTGATLGKIGLVQSEFDGALLNQRVGKFEIKTGIDKSFIKGILDSHYFLKELNKYIGEGAQGNISSEDITKTLVPKLDKPEMVSLGKKFKSYSHLLKQSLLKIKSSQSLQKSLINQIF